MSEKSSEILILFKHVYTDESGDAKKASDGEDAPDIESGQDWIAKKMEQWPEAPPEAFRVTDAAGNVLPVTIVPPQSGYVVTIGAPPSTKRTRKTNADGYKACANGDKCKGRIDSAEGSKPGNAYNLKRTKSQCHVCYEASKTPAADVGAGGGGGKGGKGKGK